MNKIFYRDRTQIKIGNRTFLGAQILGIIEYNKKLADKCGLNFEYCVIKDSGVDDMSNFLKKENKKQSFI